MSHSQPIQRAQNPAQITICLDLLADQQASSEAFQLHFLRNSRSSSQRADGGYVVYAQDEQGNTSTLVPIGSELKPCLRSVDMDGTVVLAVEGIPEMSGPLYGFGADDASALVNLQHAYSGFLALTQGDAVADWSAYFQHA